MAHLKLPRFVQAFTRNGIDRHYFRRRGFPRVPLPGEPWSAEFMAAYAAAMAGEPLLIGRGRAEAGSTSQVVLGYLASTGSDDSFGAMSAESRKTHRRVLERLAAKHGEKPFALLDKIGVEKIIAEVEGPGAKRTLRNVLRRMCKWAMAQKPKLIRSDPTEGIKVTMPETDGWHTMDDAERAQYREHHPIGTKARAAFELLFYTALRVSDAARFGPQHVRPGAGSNLGVLSIKQQKTGGEVIQPVEAAMMEAITAYPKPVTADNVAPLAYLLNKYGKPYSAKGLANAVKDWMTDADLPHCSAHTIRKGCLTFLADQGRTIHEIAARSGHKSLSMVQIYTQKADKLRLARSAAAAFEAEDGTKVSTMPDAGDRKAKKA